MKWPLDFGSFFLPSNQGLSAFKNAKVGCEIGFQPWQGGLLGTGRKKGLNPWEVSLMR